MGDLYLEDFAVGQRFLSECQEIDVAEIKASMLHYSIWPGNYVLVVPPQSRQAFHAAGWSKADLREYVGENEIGRARQRRR